MFSNREIEFFVYDYNLDFANIESVIREKVAYLISFYNDQNPFQQPHVVS